ncbi:MAG: hypothetical protein WBG86_03055 [Polyangiales bacterium]
MVRLASIGIIVALVAGCHDRKPSEPGAFPEPKPQFPHSEPVRRNRFRDIPVPGPARVEPSVIPLQEEPGPKRDLAFEFGQALGIPTRCIQDFESATATTIRIPVSATVRPTGMVIQPYVSGAGLSEAARLCIEERARLVKLPPLDGDASEPVSTIIEIAYGPPVVIEEADDRADPVLQNVREPLPKRPEVAASGRPVQAPTSQPISAAASRAPTGPPGRAVTGPRPRAIDGYEVDENAQQWR